MSGSGTWLRRYREAPGARIRLVCFPHAGGSASYYLPLARALAPAVDVLSVQYPGRQDRHREPPLPDVPRLAEAVFEALGTDLADHADLPLAFFGHSMGAIVAYETARLLEHGAGVRLEVMFASGRRAPSTIRAETVHLADDDRLLAELAALGGTDARLLRDPELRGLVLPAVRADYTAIERYTRRPGPDPSCPYEVLTGDADPLTTVAEAKAWAAHTTASTGVHVFSGGHFFVEDHLAEITELVARRLA